MRFRKLSLQEEADFRRHARNGGYVPFSEIDGVWHPAYQDECVRINTERATFVVEELRHEEE